MKKTSQEIMNEIEKQEKDFSERDRRGFIWTKRNSKWCALREQKQERLDCYKKFVYILDGCYIVIHDKELSRIKSKLKQEIKILGGGK